MIKAARNHNEVRAYVARKLPALAGVQALGRHVLAEIDDSGDGTAVEADLERMLPVELREELGHARIAHPEHILLGAQARGLVQQKTPRS